MGLRINTNTSSLTALRNLRLADRAQQESIERLSTGQRINSAADDPSGLVISEQLRAQINSLQQAQENTQDASNMVKTADSALQEVSNLLSDIKDSVVFANNDGSSNTDQLQAEQDSVDAAISAINRIANTTRFAGKNLLNGNSGFNVNSATPEIMNDLTIREMEFAQGVDSQQFSFDMTRSAARGRINIGNVAVSGDVTIRVTGERGSEDIQLNAGATSAEVMSAINQVGGETGVFASNVATSNRHALTEEFGSSEQVKIEVIENNGGGININGSTKTEGDIVSSTGIDPQIEMNGQQFTGNGREFKIVNNFGNFEFKLNTDPDISFVDSMAIDASGFSGETFTVQNSGMQFQLNEKAQVTDQLTIGIESLNSSQQGMEEIPDVIARSLSGDDNIFQGGFLSSLKSGNENDLFTDPDNAQKIVDEAITQVSRLRGHLGATESFNFEPNQDHLGVAVENLKSSESQIRDLDFAKESARFTRNQVLFQSGTAVLASANQVPQSVLSLLQ